MGRPSYKNRTRTDKLRKARKGLVALTAQGDRRELYLRPKGEHCQEWHWCQIKRHPGAQPRKTWPAR